MAGKQGEASPAEPAAVALESREAPMQSDALIDGLRFAECDAPRVSIIVLAYGNLPVTLRCLHAIAAHTTCGAPEVMVIEDHSGDVVMRQLAGVTGLRYLENVSNLGFVRSCNTAAANARGELLCFLSNDTEVTNGWLEPALQLFNRFTDCGAVGAKLVFPDGRLQQAGGIVWRDGSAWNFGGDDDPGHARYNYVREVDYCSGAALLVRHAVFNDFGGFDEAYMPADYVDIDLAFRFRQRGLKTYYSPRSVVIHHKGASHGADPSGGIKRFQARNRMMFRQRWQTVLERRHYRSGQDVFRAREHARHRRILLFMDHTLPQPDRDAGSRALLQTMLVMTRMGFLVKFWPDDQMYAAKQSRTLEEAGIEVIIEGPTAGAFTGYLDKIGGDIDFAVLSRPNFARPYIEALRRNSRARLIYFGHDLHFKRMQAQADLTGSAGDRDAALQMEATEKALWERADSVIYPSFEEADTVAQHVAPEKAHSVPLYYFDENELGLARSSVDPNLLIFVAGFGHPPNEDAAEWLVQSIMPHVWKRFPGLYLHLVGSLPTERVLALAGEWVRVTGSVSVEELEEYYQTTSAVIAPMRFGGGVKLKVVEAMARGVPLVTTRVGVQGLAEAKPYLSVADDAESLARRVIEIYEDPERAQSRAEDARGYVREYHSEQVMQAALWRALVGSMPLHLS